jgi:hypothetical protein
MVGDLWAVVTQPPVVALLVAVGVLLLGVELAVLPGFGGAGLRGSPPSARGSPWPWPAPAAPRRPWSGRPSPWAPRSCSPPGPGRCCCASSPPPGSAGGWC